MTFVNGAPETLKFLQVIKIIFKKKFTFNLLIPFDEGDVILERNKAEKTEVKNFRDT